MIRPPSALHFPFLPSSSDDGVVAGGNHRGSWGIFLFGWRAPEEVPWHGLLGCHGEEQQQSEALLQVETGRSDG